MQEDIGDMRPPSGDLCRLALGAGSHRVLKLSYEASELLAWRKGKLWATC